MIVETMHSKEEEADDWFAKISKRGLDNGICTAVGEIVNIEH